MKISPKYFCNATVHRTLSASPDNGILSCGFLVKPTDKPAVQNLTFSHYGGFLLLNGSGEYRDAEHSSITLYPGCFVQRMPDIAHATTVHPSKQWLEFFICFGRDFYNCMVNLGLFTREPVLYTGLTQQTLTQCEALLEQFRTAPDSASAELFLSAQKFVLDIVNFSKNSRCDSLHSNMAQAADILCGLDFPSPAETASRLGMGYETFRKQFRQAHQYPPAAYQMQYRLNYAKQLLLDTTKKVQEIAFLCRFSDAFAFSKAFRQHFGLSPSKFRALYTR